MFLAKNRPREKKSKITITNDKGRLSKEEIERMVQEAEKFKDEDDNHRECISAKNALENFVYSVRNSIKDEKVSSALDANEKTTIEDAVQKAIAWLDSNQDAGKVEYETKLKELEAIWCPILRRTHQGGEASGSMPDFGGSGSHSFDDNQGP